jgi:hypothetical protein
MTKSPPPLPERKLARVMKIARADSIAVVACAGFSLLLSIVGGDRVFALFSGLALACGAMEWHGHARLRSGFPDGLPWLTGAQGCLYTVIVGYVLWRLHHFNPGAFWAQVPELTQANFDAEMRKAGLDPERDRDAMLAALNFLICAVLLVVSTVYQGGLAFWYARQRTAIRTALHAGD